MVGGVSVERDEEFVGDLRRMQDNSESRPLADLLPGEWDTAHLIIGPKTEDRISEITGLDVELRGDGIYRGSFMQDRGNLVILAQEDDIQRIVSTGAFPAFGEGPVSSEAIVHGKPNTFLLKVTDPQRD